MVEKKGIKGLLSKLNSIGGVKPSGVADNESDFSDQFEKFFYQFFEDAHNGDGNPITRMKIDNLSAKKVAWMQEGLDKLRIGNSVETSNESGAKVLRITAEDYGKFKSRFGSEDEVLLSPKENRTLSQDQINKKFGI